MELLLIIGFAMLLIVGPVLMLRPSPRDRRLARIRLVAQQRRVNVQPIVLSRDPVFSRTLERNPHLPDSGWSRYQLVAADDQRGPSIHGKWIQRKFPGGRILWESESVRQVSCAAIDDLLARWEQAQQPDFLALELGPRSVAIVWNEKGDAPEVEAVCQQLQQLMAV